MDLETVAEGSGLTFTGPAAPTGYRPCLAVRPDGDDPDANPSATFYVPTGGYKDHARHAEGEWSSFWDLLVLLGAFPDWGAARDHYAVELGFEPGPPRRGEGKKKPRKCVIRPVVPRALILPKNPDLLRWHMKNAARSVGRGLAALEAATGLPAFALRKLEAEPDHHYPNAHAFPMHNELGELIGLRVRADDGSRKWCVPGSRTGLFLPEELKLRPDRLYIGEGPTDAAALLAWGFDAAGRPSAKSGADLLVRFIERVRPREVVLLTDDDDAGREGADALVPRLLRFVKAVRVVTPPPGMNDARGMFNKGLTRADVEKLVTAAPVRTLTVLGDDLCDVLAERDGGRN